MCLDCSILHLAADADGDTVKCRWATGWSGSVNQPASNVLSLNKVNGGESLEYALVLW